MNVHALIASRSREKINSKARCVSFSGMPRLINSLCRMSSCSSGFLLILAHFSCLICIIIVLFTFNYYYSPQSSFFQIDIKSYSNSLDSTEFHI